MERTGGSVSVETTRTDAEGGTDMEVLMVILIVFIYCLVLNVDMYYIMFGLAILIGCMVGLFTLGFWICGICLLFSRRKEARFTRMGDTKSSRFQVAYYLVEGKEYPCIFPKEGIYEDKLYQTDKIYHVMLNKRMGKVFDRFALTTCVLGLLFGTGVSAGIGMIFWWG